jgi:catechol 2,3-dioxygenase-like lactoylglutathione lyase family enzyme
MPPVDRPTVRDTNGGRCRPGPLLATRRPVLKAAVGLHQVRHWEALRRFAMPLNYMEHFLLQTEDIEATKDWYVKVLGFRVGPSPDFKFPVYWLYLGDRDVLHITTGGKNVSDNRKKYVGQQSEASTGTGVIDHIGFRTTGLLEMIEHLKKNSIEFKERQVDDQGLYQLFLFDPNGVKIELNFANAEAKGRKPDLSAKDLQPATN